MNQLTKSIILIGSLYCSVNVLGQQYADLGFEDDYFKEAYDLAYEGKNKTARRLLSEKLKGEENLEAQFLLARTYSWNGQFDKARKEFNSILSKEKNKSDYWAAAVKNELYAKSYAVALGLANKGLGHISNDKELLRLKDLALDGISGIEYASEGWHNTDSKVSNKKARKAKRKKEKSKETAALEGTDEQQDAQTKVAENELGKHRLGIRNAFTLFNERFDPIVFSSLRYGYKTKIGRLIPKINYNNRNGVHGLQYDIDFYPKIFKKVYAYLNYGYSNSPIFPRQKFGGDLYWNLPKGIEVSGGGRYISTASRNVTAITNSLGYYKGNYYFSLRSFVSPRDNNLWNVSGNLLVRKYLRDGENFVGISGGMGFTPELQQLFSGQTLLAETVFFVGSQRLNLEYQFTPKKSPNIYRANIGVRRQEIASNLGNYFWAFSAGLTYQVKF